jgi:hypothetical protein
MTIFKTRIQTKHLPAVGDGVNKASEVSILLSHTQGPVGLATPNNVCPITLLLCFTDKLVHGGVNTRQKIRKRAVRFLQNKGVSVDDK